MRLPTVMLYKIDVLFTHGLSGMGKDDEAETPEVFGARLVHTESQGASGSSASSVWGDLIPRQIESEDPP